MRKLLATALTCLVIAAAAQEQDRTAQIWNEAQDTLIVRLDQSYHSGLYEECVTLLQVLLAINPDDSDLSGNLVWMLGNLDRHSEAMAQAIRFNAANPKDLLGAIDLGTLYSRQKLYSRIPPVLEPLLSEADGYPLFTLLGRAYEELGLLKEGLRVWETRLKKYPDDPTTIAKVDRLRKMLRKE